MNMKVHYFHGTECCDHSYSSFMRFQFVLEDLTVVIHVINLNDMLLRQKLCLIHVVVLLLVTQLAQDAEVHHQLGPL